VRAARPYSRGEIRNRSDVSCAPNVRRLERQLPRQQPVQDDAERVQVAAVVDPAVHAPGLLGRQVGGRPLDDVGAARRDRNTRQPGGDAEPEQGQRRGRGIDEHVGRGEVTVDDTLTVHVRDGRGQVQCEVEEGRRVHRAGRPVRQQPFRLAGGRRARPDGPDQDGGPVVATHSLVEPAGCVLAQRARHDVRVRHDGAPSCGEPCPSPGPTPSPVTLCAEETTRSRPSSSCGLLPQSGTPAEVRQATAPAQAVAENLNDAAVPPVP
jgi:hypothetical protein